MDVAVPFLSPVDPVRDGIPRYFRVIKQPMDLGTVKRNLLVGAYRTCAEFAQDVRLIWLNCRSFNKNDSEIVQWVKQLEDHFEHLCQLVLAPERWACASATIGNDAATTIDAAVIRRPADILTDFREQFQKKLLEQDEHCRFLEAEIAAELPTAELVDETLTVRLAQRITERVRILRLVAQAVAHGEGIILSACHGLTPMSDASWWGPSCDVGMLFGVAKHGLGEASAIVGDSKLSKHFWGDLPCENGQTNKKLLRDRKRFLGLFFRDRAPLLERLDEAAQKLELLNHGEMATISVPNTSTEPSVALLKRGFETVIQPELGSFDSLLEQPQKRVRVSEI